MLAADGLHVSLGTLVTILVVLGIITLILWLLGNRPWSR